MRKKLIIVGSIVIGLLLAAALSIQIFVSFWISPVLTAVFKESVSYTSSGLYKVTYADMDIDPFQQNVTFKDFKLDFDSTRVEKEDSLKNRKWVSASVGDFELGLGNFWSMLPQRYLLVEKLSIKQPRMVLYDYSDGTKKKDSVSLDKIQKFDAHELIKEYFDSLDVNTLAIEGANLKWINKVDDQLPFSLGDIHADILDLHVDSSTVKRNYGYPYAREFVLQVEESSFTTEDSLYTFNIGHLKADPIRQELVIEKFSMVPQMPRYEFAKGVGHQISRVDLDVQQIKLERIDLHFLVSELALLVGKISIEEANLLVLKDKRLPEAPYSEKPLVQAAIQNVPVPFRLDTLIVKKAFIQYEEHMPKAEVPGKITFEEVYMTAYTISNLDSLKEDNLIMEADVQAKLMGKSTLKVHFDFPLNKPDYQHFISGEMYDFPLQAMNSMLENTVFASIDSGFAYALKFRIDANQTQSSGEVHFAYKDLKIRLLNKDTPDDPTIKEKLGSFVANLFLVKTDNPSSNSKSLRIGEVGFERDPNKSFFSYWAKSLISGVKGSMGLGNTIPNKNEEVKEEEEKKGFFKRIFQKDEAEESSSR